MSIPEVQVRFIALNSESRLKKKCIANIIKLTYMKELNRIISVDLILVVDYEINDCHLCCKG